MACFISDDISVVPFSSFRGRQDFFVYEYGVMRFERPDGLIDD